MLDGTVLTIWASAFSKENGVYLFDNLADASDDEQARLEITARTPSNPERVMVLVARIPAAAVHEVVTGDYP